MQPTAARHLLDRSLGAAYDEDAFRGLVRNLFKAPDELSEAALTGPYVFDAYRDHVRQYKRLAKVRDAAGYELDVLAVELKTPAKLDRARTMQRNFAATYLDRKGRDAALVAYHTTGRADWRLSLVRLAYGTAMGADGKVKVEKEVTPARRYSFLVGEGEPIHTAKQQLLDLLTRDDAPTVDGLEDAFGIERVTDAFFDEYAGLFEQLRGDLDAVLAGDDAARQAFAAAGLHADAFAKKLLGQIVFLYFLQKKGWLGVEAGQGWGEGPKDFLRRLFDGRAAGPYDNFFDDRLEPLFYEALATERGADGFYSRFGCRIPFLNGGLFEPPGDYPWATVPLRLPDATFAAVLDTFDRYNFTVREDEPLEKEVAVDPEMLGKVFEKLLADRKEVGAFYTPRAIVAYMCDASLVAYLDDAVNGDGQGGRRATRQPLAPEHAPQGDIFGGTPPTQGTLAEETAAPRVPREALERLVREGERWIENDRRVRAAERETDTYRWMAPDAVRAHAEALDDALARVRVCDPAIGSGAFPVGMMQAIVRTRDVLSTYLPGPRGEAGHPERTAYAFKRHAIRHSLYGVDLKPSAVDIAQLRLWLSLVVDEEDFQRIQPLPNLRYKVVQGDALGGVAHHLGNNAAFAALQRLIPQHVAESSPVKKKRLQAQIDALIDEVAGATFDFGVYFGEVMRPGGDGSAPAGFDVVIGNPPYVTSGTLTAAQKDALKAFEVHARSADLCTYFVERGLKLLRPGGVFAYIISNKWMRARYGTALRTWLKRRHLVEIIDFKDLPVFQGTAAYPCILRVEKRRPPADAFRAVEVETLDYGDLAAYADAHAYPVRRADLRAEGWSLATPDEQRLLRKLRGAGTPLGKMMGDSINYGLKTGCNKVFKIDEAKRAELIAQDPSSAEIIKPFLAGREVGRYRPPEPDQYVVFTRRGIDIDAYPAVKAYLEEHKERLMPKPKGWQKANKGKRWPGRKKGSYAWYELQDAVDYYEAFEDTKILFTDLSRRGDFTLDEDGIYPANTLYFIARSGRYLLGVLNSRLAGFYYVHHFATYRGNYLRFFKDALKRLPIIPEDEAPDDLRAAIEAHVERLLALHAAAGEDAGRQAAIRAEEAAVDRLVYALYGLTDAEVALVERRVPEAAG